MALLLRNHGIRRVRPLAGGLAAWRKKGYPVVEHAVGETLHSLPEIGS